jgi:flagellar motor switch protein FliN/FliY
MNEARDVDFVEAEAAPAPGAARGAAVLRLPIELVVSVGSAKLTVAELMEMKRDQVVSLDAKIADPVDLMVGGRVVARGELVDLEGEDGGIGVRVREIVEAQG